MLSEKEIKYKIDYEIIVDCYDEYEVSMGWYYFMEETIEFPFRATAKLKKLNGSIEQKEIEIIGLASDEEGFIKNDFDLEIEAGEHVGTIAYSKLSSVKASPETMEAFTIWNHWVSK